MLFDILLYDYNKTYFRPFPIQYTYKGATNEFNKLIFAANTTFVF
jgi:hypothetical protein